jgi:hypothetical protein
MSRSRPYRKNDNAWVEQRHWTHVRKVVEYRRMNTIGESCRFRASCMRVSRCTRKALEAGSPIPVAAVQEKPAA